MNGLAGQNVHQHVTKENNNAKGNALVQEIVTNILKKKEIVRIYHVAKEHLVNGLTGENVQQHVTKENNNAKGNVLVQEIVMDLLKRKEIVQIYQVATTSKKILETVLSTIGASRAK